MSKIRWSVLGLALVTLVLGLLVGLMTVGTVSADPTPGVRFQIPRIDIGELYGTGDWSTWIQVQNVSPPDPVTGIEPATGAVFFGWEEPSDPTRCPPNEAGPSFIYCQLIQGNAIWTLRSQLNEAIKSGIIYSVPAGPDGATFREACDDASDMDWLDWEDKWMATPGEEVAVTVNRYGPNSYGTFVSSAYTGISEEMDGSGYPYEYYAPYVMRGYYGQDTELTIQNSGQVCTSVWINFLEQGSCGIVYKKHIEQLAPGESIRLRVPKEVNRTDPNGCFWLGSAHITAEQPLGIIVDETSFDEPCFPQDQGVLLTHRARAKVETRDGVEMEDTKAYADLIFREWSGWQSSIQVQNLSRDGLHTFVTVDFMDQSGDEILFLADWVCPSGSATFFLPAVVNLGAEYVGAAEIESHDQISYPGAETPAQPIFAVVDLKRPALPPLTPYSQGGSYNAHPYSQKEWVDEIALPFMAKDALAPEDPYTPWTSMIAIRNNSNCNKIRPTVWFKDETGRLLCEINSIWLRPKHITMIDLNNIGCLHAGYIGAAKVLIQPENVEQLCDLDNDGHVDNLPTMPSVVVVEKGAYGAADPGIFEGDITKIYEGTPYSFGDKHCGADLLGMVVDSETLEPIEGATITVPDAWADYFELAGRWVYDYMDATGTTGVAGMYEVEDVITYGTLEPDPGTCYTVLVEAPGYHSATIADVCLHCGEDELLDVALVSECEDVTVRGTVEDKETGLWLEGVEVTAWNAVDAATATTDANGEYTISDLAFDADSPINVTAVLTGYNASLQSVYIPECGGIAEVSFQVHQTPMSRILLYYGNGGNAPDLNDPGQNPLLPADGQVPTNPITVHNYFAAQLVFENLGFEVDYTGVWPSDPDLEEYKVIFLLGPGNGHDAAPYDRNADMFTPGQVAQIDLFLRNGGRLVVMTDVTDTTGSLTSIAPISMENTLVHALNDLDLEFQDTDNDGWSEGQIANALPDDLNGPDQLLGDTVPTTPITDVHSLDFNTAVSITVNAANANPGYIAALDAPNPNAGAIICAADVMAGVTRLDASRAPFAGDVVLIGDKDWMDDASFMGTISYTPFFVWPDWPADNENLLLNIVTF